MKILYFITRSDVLGGASIHLIDLALGMQAKGHSVIIYAGGTGRLNRYAKEKGLEVKSVVNLTRSINITKDILAFFEFKNIINFESPDIIHLHSSKSGILGRLAAKFTGFPCVFTAHGWSFTDGVSFYNKFLYKIIECSISKLTDHIITVSNYDKAIAINNCISEKNMTCVHNGVTDLVDERYAALTSMINESVNIVMVARFDNQKNHKFLVEALASLKNLDYKLHFIGDGPNLDSINSLVNFYGLQDKILFYGTRNDVASFLFHADIFVLTSNWEGLPLTILEALSHSLPIIASDVGGVSESVHNNINGFLIPRNDLSSLIVSLEELISNSTLRNDMGLSSRSIYDTHFKIELMLNKTELIYKQVFKNYYLEAQ